MSSFNRITIIGNLTRDPIVKQLPSNTTLAEFGLAMSRKYRTAAGEDKEEVCFVDCTAFGRQAETIAQWCRKGKQLFVEGRLKYDTWEDRQGGAKRSKLSIVVENFQFLGSRDGDATVGSDAATEKPQTRKGAGAGRAGGGDANPFTGKPAAPPSIGEEDIPW
jgi:single-strand DNA-binding protein